MINLKVRFKHKGFWSALIALLLVLANQIAGLFGMDVSIYNDQLTAITETTLTILGLVGVLIDPTTKGLTDSEQAMNYDKPKE